MACLGKSSVLKVLAKIRRRTTIKQTHSVNLCPPPLEKKEIGIAFSTFHFSRSNKKKNKVPTRKPKQRITHHVPGKTETNVPLVFFKDQVHTFYILE